MNKKRKSIFHGRNMGKRLLAAGGLLAALGMLCRFSQGELEADYVEQAPWRLIRAEAVSEGIEVETAGRNLVLLPGVRVKADSEENKSFSASRVRDGISDDTQLRWSSLNDWENNEHWLEVCFGRKVKLGLIRIYWERTNACAYALEYSDDGKSWETAAEFTERPGDLIQDVYLDETIEAEYLRLHVTAVEKREEDLSLYYQNVSVLELEAYEGIEDSFLIRTPEIPAGSYRRLDTESGGADGGQSGMEEITAAPAAEDGQNGPEEIAVALPEVPDGYRLEFAGADYEMLVDAEGRIANTIADTRAELGFALVRDGVRRELPGIQVEIPAAARTNEGQERLEGIPVMEWKAGGGTFALAEEITLVIAKEQEEQLAASAQLFADELAGGLGTEVSVRSESMPSEREEGAPMGGGESEPSNRGKGSPMGGEESEPSDRAEGSPMGSEESESSDRAEKEQGLKGRAETITLMLDDGQEGADWPDGLGEEGYEIDLEKRGIRISAKTLQGLRWGCVTFLELLGQSRERLPEGQIRDYPRYSVRGFGIDVGRRPVSMELLYRIVEEMSKEKMNTLQVHLNDNQIIAQSGYDGTESGARSLYAGFRLESDLKNEAGKTITSEDLFYTKEEFAQFIADAVVYGVEIVPEIDTPAHSLAITNVFPRLGLSGNPESVDQLDLSKPEAVELGKALWSEYLTGSTAVFGACDAVHIGMDEYFGDEKAYISYLTELSAHVREIAPDKQIRIWGSLSMITADHSGVSKDLQLHIWDTDWADPQDMYEEGFSVINSVSSSLYIIPGGGYDWLDQEFLEKSWQPNIFETQERTWIIPAYSPKMLGASYMMWNDWSHLNGETITEDDLFDRFAKPLPVIAAKLWGSRRD